MRQDYQQFLDRGAEVIAVGPDGMEPFKRYWAQEKLPFTGLSDSSHQVLKRYCQQFNLLKMGRMPAVLVIDRQGSVRYRHDGANMSDIPENQIILSILDDLNRES